MVKTYKSAIDLWVAVLLIGLPSLAFFTGISITFGLHWLQWHENIGRIAGFAFVGGGMVLCALIATFVIPCRYTLRESDLTIHCGMLVWRIPYRDVQRLELSCNLWLAPALSVNRVRLVLSGGTQLVSPSDRASFVQDLQSRLPHA